MVATRVRYSDADLADFKKRIEQKLEYARDDYEFVKKQLEEQTENMESEGDWMDSSSSNNDLELLYIMANRQKKHINDLERALIRVTNKTYGICEVTGELIDKRRLMAVPTTAKSLAAKLGEVSAPKDEEEEEEKPKMKQEKKKEPVVFSRVVKKPSAIDSKSRDFEDDDEDEDYDDEDLDLGFEVSDDDEEFDVVDPSSLENDEDEDDED